MNNDETYTPCTKCGRPMAYCKGQCCGKPQGCQCKEYCGKVCGAIRKVDPSCPPQAVIPSVTVESVSNLKDLADCFVYVSNINTTFYIDDKHRIMTTWAGLVSVDDYDFDANPLNLRSQIAYDAKNNKAAIYDKQGVNYIFQISDINNDYMLLEDKPQINGVTLEGNKTSADLGILEADEVALVFDTVADMKLATNLVAGSYAQTLGFHSINDGGGALYKITNTGTANEMDVIAIGDLRASLILGEHANVMQFGAYGDNTHDDSSVLQYVLTNFDDVLIPDKQFAYATTLQVTRSNQIIKCNGVLKYSGLEAAIKFVSGVDDDIFIRKISSNAIGLLIQPSASCGRNNVTVNDIDSQAECFKVIGQYSTSSWYLYGLRWNSIANYAINMEIPTGSTNIYYNRFMFHNMALLAHPSGDTKGILLTDLGGSGCEIQVQFTEVNFENAKGIRTSGKVGYLSITNCRLTEIADTEWFEVNGNVPNTVITGAGRIFLKRLRFKNITSGEMVVLNIRCQDSGLYSGAGYSYSGGIIVRTSDNLPLFIPNDANNTHYAYEAANETNTVGDESGRDTEIPLMTPARIRVTSTAPATTVTVPGWVYNNRTSILLGIVASTTVSLKYSSNTVGSLTGPSKTYLVPNTGNFGKAILLP